MAVALTTVSSFGQPDSGPVHHRKAVGPFPRGDGGGHGLVVGHRAGEVAAVRLGYPARVAIGHVSEPSAVEVLLGSGQVA